MKHLSKTSFVALLLAAFVSTSALAAVSPTDTAGRYKKGSDGKCYWDANDSGPDQCKPPKGRYKKDGDKCVWDANDEGPDQCTPKKGRYKLDKSGNCTFDANDSGPDQCKPR